MGSFSQQELHLQSLSCLSHVFTSGVVAELGYTLVSIFSNNNEPEIALFAIASYCKDARVQNIHGVNQGFAVGAENDSK